MFTKKEYFAYMVKTPHPVLPIPAVRNDEPVNEFPTIEEVIMTKRLHNIYGRVSLIPSGEEGRKATEVINRLMSMGYEWDDVRPILLHRVDMGLPIDDGAIIAVTNTIH
jgi:hypothetical protein